MAALSFCRSSPPRILHKQSKSSLFPPDSTLFTPLCLTSVGELSAKPISVSRRFRVAVNSTAVSDSSGNAKLPSSPTKKLREIMQSPGVLQGPCCFDALSAKLVERAGFPYCITSGFSISAARLGLPDKGVISYGEIIDQGQQITQSVSISVIGDGGNGYGNPMNVKRTVKGYNCWNYHQ